MEIIFIRHSKPDYSFINKDMNCQWCNLAPLSHNGIEIAQRQKNNELLLNTDIILSSPYTRALQTAHILFPDKNIIVEPMLHEWLPDSEFNIKGVEVCYKNRDYKNKKGMHVENETWETKESMKNRLKTIIEKYSENSKIIIVAHERLISSFLDIDKKIEYCEILRYNTDSREL